MYKHIPDSALLAELYNKTVVEKIEDAQEVVLAAIQYQADLQQRDAKMKKSREEKARAALRPRGLSKDARGAQVSERSLAAAPTATLDEIPYPPLPTGDSMGTWFGSWKSAFIPRTGGRTGRSGTVSPG